MNLWEELTSNNELVMMIFIILFSSSAYSAVAPLLAYQLPLTRWFVYWENNHVSRSNIQCFQEFCDLCYLKKKQKHLYGSMAKLRKLPYALISHNIKTTIEWQWSWWNQTVCTGGCTLNIKPTHTFFFVVVVMTKVLIIIVFRLAGGKTDTRPVVPLCRPPLTLSLLQLHWS